MSFAFSAKSIDILSNEMLFCKSLNSKTIHLEEVLMQRVSAIHFCNGEALTEEVNNPQKSRTFFVGSHEERRRNVLRLK